ncbi:uncharacterized protein LOC133642176 [Entelurus aequoreus]|uniref:uncharacterized protein LOC133642176 n=1 Tax=Entelurus aequoreus TaxID=161455 RepID=UPI002B1D1A5B|nr:uncharacterized protein LOC133642176 [Entelurus aequoreus]
MRRQEDVQVSHFLCEAMALSVDVPMMLALAMVLCGVLCGVMLACVDCWRNAPLVTIREDIATDEYILSTEFPPTPPHVLMTSLTSDLLSPMAPPPDAGSERGCVTPTQSESNASYENSHTGLDYPECFAEDYVLVLPDASTNQSAASTPSSGVRHEYVNVPAGEWREPSGSSPLRAMERLFLSDDREYLDVTPHSADSTSGETSTLSSQSEDDEANYVNQPGAHG